MKYAFALLSLLLVGILLENTLQVSQLIHLSDANAQSSNQIVWGPYSTPFRYAGNNGPYLTNRSSTKATNLPRFSLPEINLYQYINNTEMPVQMDVNGDGLFDFVYSSYWENSSPPGSYPYAHLLRQYIMLNTGSNFQLAYVCKHVVEYWSSGQIRYNDYYGDCAG
jgi:hypothetical protein